jgi:hypothetical protein
MVALDGARHAAIRVSDAGSPRARDGMTGLTSCDPGGEIGASLVEPIRARARIHIDDVMPLAGGVCVGGRYLGQEVDRG